MNLLNELTALLRNLNIPVETGFYSDTPPNEYVVVVPMADTFELFADNLPKDETQEARISLYTKNNYLKVKNSIERALLNADITITERRYIVHEDDTGYHHYAIDVMKNYEVKEE